MHKAVNDCVIIGGGASGLFAACYLKYLDPYCDICIVEKMPRVGKKLLLTGSGRCNISNARISAKDYHTDDEDKLSAVLKSFDVNETVQFYENNLGIVLTRKGDLYYPLTLRSATVLDSLRFYIEERGVEFILEDPAVRVASSVSGYLVQLKSGSTVSSSNILIATGGRSYPKTGSEGDAIELANKFLKSEDIIPYAPALVPLTSDKPGIKNLAGIRFNGSISIISDDREHARSEGEILFAKDGGLTGIAVLDVSDTVLRLLDKGDKPYASLNLIGKSSGDVLMMLYIRRQLFPNRTVCDAFSGIIHRVLLEGVLRDCNIDPRAKVSSINDAGLTKISNVLCGWSISLSGAKGFEDAQVSSGGIKLGCLTDNMEYKGSRGLFFAGEAVNVNGICGGYNLQWAWSSAVCAARGILDV